MWTLVQTWDWLAALLLAIGGVAWVIYAFTKVEIVKFIAFKNDIAKMAIYALVGLAGAISLWGIITAIFA